MKKIVISMLHSRVRAVLRKFQPKIIAVTGSVGKTSAKQAIYLALDGIVDVRTAEKNYNNEIGVPLTILGAKSPKKSIVGWLSLFFNSYRIKEYPEVLVLEYGADHPGDIATLCALAQPNVGVVTGVSTVHAEYFTNIDELAREKATLVGHVPPNGLAVLNADDVRVVDMVDNTHASVKTFGIKSLDVSVSDIRIAPRIDHSFESGETFAVTTALVKQENIEVGQLILRNMVGYAPVMACLAAITVADHFNIPAVDVIKKLNTSFSAVPGRLNPISGIKGSLILDDSYNAAPSAMQNGLEVLRMFAPGEEQDRRIAVLGQMAELGKYSEEEHRLVGMKAAEVADIFIAVGERMSGAVEAAKEAGMEPEAIEWFGTSQEAGRYLDKIIEQGDIVYVKGSQSSRMERVVKDVMAQPLMASQLLVRQEAKWLK
jgi:UDP-N-acetylmuramyl pentapeptide synthase